MKKNIPIWKRSCIEGLTLCEIRRQLYDFADIEYDYFDSSRKEDFQIFFYDISARAERLLDLINEYSYGFDNWDDYIVVFLGGVHRVLGYDMEQEDYYSLFARGFGVWGENLAIEAANERLQRLTKSELLSNWHKVLTIITTYMDVKAAYDSLVGALDFLENDGLKKSEELTADIEQAYRNLWCSDGVTIDWKTESAFEAALKKTYREMWII